NQMFGVASRGNGDFNFNQTVLDINGAIVGFRAGVGRNVLYELNRDTGAAISYNTVRTGNARAQGAGTPTVEVGTLQFANGVQVQGVVKGAAFIGTRMYFVTDIGEIFFLDNIPTSNPNPTNTRFLLTDPVTNGYKFVTDEFGNPIRFA